MAEYFVPRVQVEQEFSQIPTFTEKPLAALIIGPQYNLFRYAEAAEKANTVVLSSTNDNIYTGSETDYTYQGQASNTTDLSSIKVFLDNTQLTCFDTVTRVNKVNGTNNQIQTNYAGSALTLKTGFNGTISAAFMGRPVSAGDIILLQDAASSPTATLTTKVASVKYSNSAATVPATGTKSVGMDADITCTIGGTFTGTKDINYRIIVEEGGAYGVARVKVISDDVDSSGPFVVAESTAYALGTQGLTFTFDSSATGELATGDEVTVAITAAAPNKYDIIVLEDNIPTTGWSSVYINEIRLVKSGVAIPELVDSNGTSVNWVATQDGITLSAGITVVTPETTISSVAQALPVASANVLVQRRDLVATYTTSVQSVTSTGQVSAKLGTIHPDNPLAKGVYNAVLNSADTVVYFVAVATDDLAGYNKALELARKDNKYYGIVPLSYDTTIQQAVYAHVIAMSDSKQAKWRVAWLAAPVKDSDTILNLKTDSTAWKAYVTANPSGGAYNYVTIGSKVSGTNTPDTAAALLTLGVRAGDILNYNYRYDAAGNVAYDSVKITDVLSQNTFVVETAWTAAQSTPFKVTITRNYTSSEKASNYASLAAGYDQRRVRLVFPDTYKSGSVTENGYLLAASLAGLRSGVVPHQSLTNIEVLGPTDLSRVISDFTEDDLDTIAQEGVWIVTQTTVNAPAYTRHQLTTDSTSLNFSEDSITANVDSISYGLQKALAPYVGVYNINAGSLLKVRAAIDNELSYRMTATYTERAGTQLNGYEIKKVAQDTTFKDKVLVEIGIDVPEPMNYITITLLV